MMFAVEDLCRVADRNGRRDSSKVKVWWGDKAENRAASLDVSLVTTSTISRLKLKNYEALRDGEQKKITLSLYTPVG
jgi:hypothetical protein